MNKARAMLDALMGPGRDVAPKDHSTAKWKDRTVCKNYLIGFCGKDKSVLGGKRTIEVCSKIHSDEVRQQFEQAPEEEREAYRKDCELISLKDLDVLLRECEAHSNLERQWIRDPVRRRHNVLSPEVNMRLSAIKRESIRLFKFSELLDDDKLKEKTIMVDTSNELLQKHEDVLKEETRKANEAQESEEVCEVCGTAYKGKADYDIHLNYRVHQGYAEVRKRHAELKAKKDAVDKVKEDEAKAKKEAIDKEREAKKEARQKRKEESEKARAKEHGEDGKDSKENERDKEAIDKVAKDVEDAKAAKDDGKVEDDEEKDEDYTDEEEGKKERKGRSRKDRSRSRHRKRQSRGSRDRRDRRRADRGRRRSRSRRRR